MANINTWFRIYPYDLNELAYSKEGQNLLTIIENIFEERLSSGSFMDSVETDTHVLSAYFSDYPNGISSLNHTGLSHAAHKAGLLFIQGEESTLGFRHARQEVHLPDGRTITFHLDGLLEPTLGREMVEKLNSLSSTPEEAFSRMETYLTVGEWSISQWVWAIDNGELDMALGLLGIKSLDRKNA